MSLSAATLIVYEDQLILKGLLLEFRTDDMFSFPQSKEYRGEEESLLIYERKLTERLVST